MENKRQVGAGSLDHLFGPKDSSPSSSSHSSGIFESIFSPPSKVPGKDSGILGNRGVGGKYGNPDNTSHNSKGEGSGTSSKEKSSAYQNEASEPCYFSSSIYYGGQENYSPRTRKSESDKPDGEDDGNNSNTASRGNWWQGSLYY